jgi:hypothetical protein
LCSFSPEPSCRTTALPATIGSSDKSAGIPTDGSLSGLTNDEAAIRLKKFGPNATPDTAVHPLRSALSKFWSPVPWMLEAAIVLEVALGKYVEAAIIMALLVFNAALGFFHESRAQATLAALKSRLALNASVRRGGAWKIVPAVELVRGDIVKLSLGAVVAARCAPGRGVSFARPVDAHRRIDTYRSWSGLADACRRAGAARRGGCESEAASRRLQSEVK